MRYTRYNYKPPKRKNNNFMFVIILTLVAAVALGTVFSKLLPKNNATSSKDKTTSLELKKDDVTNKSGVVDTSKVTVQTNTKDYVLLRCGVFSKKENALILKNSLMKFGIPFIMKEDNTYKVMAGIYPKESIDIITKQLQANKINFAKVNFKVIGNDNASIQLNEMISADVKILNKLSEKDTKAIQTVELKKWLTSLQGAEEKSISYKDMTEIKTYLNKLPAELNKDKTEEGYIFIYRFIKKISKL